MWPFSLFRKESFEATKDRSRASRKEGEEGASGGAFGTGHPSKDADLQVNLSSALGSRFLVWLL